MSATEISDVKTTEVKPQATPLVGKGAMKDAERAAFLQKARTDEASYSSKDYVRDNDPQHRFYDPDHPVNLKPKIENGVARVGMLRESINEQLDSPFVSFRLQESLKAYANTHTTLARNQAILDSHLESRNVTNQSGAALTHTSAVSQSTESNLAAQGIKTKALPEIYKKQVAINLPPDMLDMMNVNEIKTYHANLDNHVDQLKQKHGAKMVAAIGLMAAAETVYATPGSISTKLDATGKVLKDQVVDAIPGVTYTQKMAAGKYQDAALDAAGYLPLGDAASVSRLPAVQAVIDALPKDRAALEKMKQDKTQAPINRHLAEYQLAFIDAKEKGDVFKGLNASSHLTDLAEQKIVLEVQWKKSAEHFSAAIKDNNTNWAQLAKNSDIAPQAAIHLAAINSGYPVAFVEKMDAALAKNLAAGTPVSPEMMAITKSVQLSAAQPQADAQITAHQQVLMTR